MPFDPAVGTPPCSPGRRRSNDGKRGGQGSQGGTDFRLDLPADAHSVRSALRRAVARFRRQITADEAGAMELVLAEVLNNIVKHAYADRQDGTISLRIARDPMGLVCRIADQGGTMPGGTLPEGAARSLSPDGDLSDLPEGGFGWFLIRELTRNVTYARDGATNRLQFVLPLCGS